MLRASGLQDRDVIGPIVAEFPEASRDRLTRIVTLTPERDASVP
jgi:hypothetical protein